MPQLEADAFAVRVYHEDTDFSGLVYHASYLSFLERRNPGLHAQEIIYQRRRQIVDLQPARRTRCPSFARIPDARTRGPAAIRCVPVSPHADLFWPSMARLGRPHVRKLVDEALAGEDVAITRHGKVVAYVRSAVERPVRQPPHELVAQIMERAKSRPSLGENAVDIIRRMRDGELD